MKSRCYSPEDGNYQFYGAKGISVCEEWKEDFKAFYDWAISNGWVEGSKVTRVNKAGDHSPENSVVTPAEVTL